MTFLTDPVPDIQGQLCDLAERGFQFVRPIGEDGGIAAVLGVRTHDDVVDVVCFRGPEEAKAVRMSSDEPDILAPTETVWRRTGPAVIVLTDLLALPDDYRGPDSDATPRTGADVRVGAS